MGALIPLLVSLLLILPFSGGALTNGLALKPPMGWNSWNRFGCNVSDSMIRAMADAMATNGMKAAGYEFINIDDCWQVARDANGVIVPDPVRFPYGIKALADYIHSKGLKLGLYSDHGYATCAGRPGAYGYEYLDANTYAAWGVDYLKHDNCNLPSGDIAQLDYFRMADGLMRSGRPIVFSICAWQFDSWMPQLGNLWRTTGDISDSFTSMQSCLNGNHPPAFLAGPGRWNDPDMLEVGNGGMTFAEQQAHFSLWCIVGAPLLAGNDLRTASGQTLSILTNAELLAVDQDPAGVQGVRLPNTSTNQVWVKPLGTDFSLKAVALFNPNTNASTITVNWTNVGLRPGSAAVRDLWAGVNIGAFNDGFTTNVPAHSVVVLKVTGSPPLLPALGTNYLSSLQSSYAYVGWNTLGINRTVDGNPLRLRGATYTNGLGAHAFSGIDYRLGGIGSRFQAVVGVDDEVSTNGSVVFHVLGDGMPLYRSAVLRGGSSVESIDLDVTGVNRLTLGVTDADDSINYDHADWANARIIVTNVVPARPAAPGGLRAAQGLPITLAWNPVCGATSYTVKRGPTPAGPFTNIASAVSADYADLDVTPGVFYHYVVSTVSKFGQSTDSAPVSALACTPPQAPSALSLRGGSNVVEVSWPPVPGATSYAVVRAMSSTPFELIAPGVTTTSFTDSGVTNGTSYSYAVHANNACAQSSRSPFAVITPNLPPGAPSGLDATVAGSRVLFMWNATPSAESYNLKCATSSAGPFVTVTNVTTGPRCLQTGLAAGMTYYYVVSAINSGGEGADSPSVGVSACSESLPLGWSSQDIGAVAIAGSSSSCGSTFIIQGGGSDIWNTADQFQFASTPVAGDSTLVCRVKYLQSTDPWAKAGLMYRDDNSASSAFVDMIISAGSGASFQWRSTSGGGCSAATVQGIGAPAWVRLVRSGNTFTGFCSVDGTNWIQTGTATVTLRSTPLAGLAVTAHNNATLSCAAFEYTSTGAPATPSGIRSAADLKKVTLEWSESFGAVSYSVLRALSPGGPYADLAIVQGSTYADTSIANGITYYYQLAAINPIGSSAYSALVAATVPLPSLTARVETKAVLLLSWPLTASPFSLQSATNLQAPVGWLLVTNTGSVVNDTNTVSVTSAAGPVFYRLVHP